MAPESTSTPGIAAVALSVSVRRVLIVDDSQTDAHITRRVLAGCGFQPAVRVAETGQEAVALPAAEAPDVVFLDVHLAEGPSFPWIARLREAYPRAAIIMLTGSSSDETALAALGSGANDYLRKQDLAPALLAKTMAYALERRRFERSLQQQAVTRKVVRRLLRDLAEGASTLHRRRDLGRSIANEQPHESVDGYLETFRGMGIGELRLERQEGVRFVFQGTGLLEVTPGSHPTCHIPLGYLEGALGTLCAGSALGSEIQCQSQGHDACVFVLKARPAADAGAPRR